MRKLNCQLPPQSIPGQQLLNFSVNHSKVCVYLSVAWGWNVTFTERQNNEPSLFGRAGCLLHVIVLFLWAPYWFRSVWSAELEITGLGKDQSPVLVLIAALTESFSLCLSRSLNSFSHDASRFCNYRSSVVVVGGSSLPVLSKCRAKLFPLSEVWEAWVDLRISWDTKRNDTSRVIVESAFFDLGR